ncbi:MAG TPA: DUF4886 domain-containing protein [Kiritimatiellia bacterium]|jgi:hypothetical protein|nr:DUF4886 domain-containing protein [Kiritimatiellia bacterium]HRU20472.1 DUF4886 domain-containing protein [Kiritimatiellia bacterium]
MKAKIKLIVVATLAAFNLFSNADAIKVATETKPLKVLMIGNSFSDCVLRQAPQIAQNLDCPLNITSLYIGGCPLSRHAANLDTTNAPYMVSWSYCGNSKREAVPFAKVLKTRKNKDGKQRPNRFGNLRQMIAADKWDIVTIQQASHESWRPESFQPHADKLIAAVRELAPQAQFRIQQTWSYCTADKRIHNPETNGPGTWGFDQTGMYERLTANYTKLAKDTGFAIIPMGLAVQKFRKAKGIKSHEGDVVGNIRMENGKATGDTIHLNGAGHYLQGLVWVGTLFDVDVTKCTYAPKNMDPELAKVLRACAAAAVAETRGVQTKK